MPQTTGLFEYSSSKGNLRQTPRRSSRRCRLAGHLAFLRQGPRRSPPSIRSAAAIEAAQATRARAPPTLIRRTPRSADSATLIPGPLARTLSGLGATARTIVAISAFSRAPGRTRQSAPASAKATSLSIAGLMAAGRSAILPSGDQNRIFGRSVDGLRAARMRSTA